MMTVRFPALSAPGVSQLRIGMALLLALYGWTAAAVAQRSASSSGQTTDSGQIRIIRQEQMRGPYNVNVLDPVADRIRAQGDRVESFGRFLRTVAEAQLIQEEVKLKQIEYRIERLKELNERRRLRWEGQEAIKDRNLKEQKRKYERKQERLKEVPVHVVDAASGNPLNHLLEGIQMQSYSDLPAAGQANLPAQWQAHVRICVGAGPSRAAVGFHDPKQTFSFLVPVVLRREAFQEVLAEFAAARERMIASLRAGKQVSPDDFEAAMKWHEELDKLLQQEVGTPKGMDYATWRRTYDPCKDFLDEQLNQLGYLSVAQSIPQPFTGKTVADLILYMKGNGYRFDRAAPGGDSTYLALFNALREVAKAVAQ